MFRPSIERCCSSRGPSSHAFESHECRGAEGASELLDALCTTFTRGEDLAAQKHKCTLLDLCVLAQGQKQSMCAPQLRFCIPVP